MALGIELGTLYWRVSRRIFRLGGSNRQKNMAKGKRIQSALARAIDYYNSRDPRLWDELYEVSYEGLNLKSFTLPEGYLPLRRRMKDVDTTVVEKKAPRLPGDWLK